MEAQLVGGWGQLQSESKSLSAVRTSPPSFPSLGGEVSPERQVGTGILSTWTCTVLRSTIL
jgi:hypothetical protein